MGTYLHVLGFVDVCISPILFAMNGLNCRLYPFTHHKTLILSVQNVMNSLSMFNVSATDKANYFPKTDAVNSKRGILNDCNGATLVLDATNDSNTFLSLFSDLI